MVTICGSHPVGLDGEQVKFVHEAFRRLRPGIPLSCLHGRMKQMQRMVTFYKFNETKHALLFATDVAARGLDFPDVDWVLQVTFKLISSLCLGRNSVLTYYLNSSLSVIYNWLKCDISIQSCLSNP